MKKLALVLAAAAAAVSTFAAEPIGVDVGVDVGIGGFNADDVVVTASPYLGYGTAVAGMDLGLTLGFDATLTPDYSSDDVYLDIGLSKGFALSDAAALVPGLTVTNTINLGDSSWALDVEPAVSLETGMFTTSAALPMGVAPDFTVGLGLSEAVSLGDLGLEVYADCSLSPDVSFDDVGVSASYPVAGVGLALTAEFSGFDADIAVDLTAGVSCSF